jgi:type I restriction enzyme, S subunit
VTSSRRLRARFLFDVVDERCGHRDLPLLSVSASRGVVARSTITDDEPRADDLTNYKVCRPGDIVVNRMSAYQGALGSALLQGIVSPDYIVLRPCRNVDSRWLHHTVRSSWFVSEMSSRVRGIGSIGTANVRTPRVSAEEIGEIAITVPPLRTQLAIADYLDTETTRIDALTAKKRRMIELVHERASIVREQSFSSVPGWPIKRLLAAPMAYGILVPRFVDPGGGERMLRITNLNQRGDVQLEDVAWVDSALSEEFRRTRVAEGDLILSVVGSLGRAAIVSADAAGSNLNRPLARIQVAGEWARLVWHWIQSESFLDQARLAVGASSAQPTLNLGDLAAFNVGLPLDRSLWGSILERLESAAAQANRMTDALERQIDLLVERRQALITAAVTGELAIPGVTA